MRIKLLIPAKPYVSATNPKKPQKRIHNKLEYEAGEIINIDRVDADKYIEAQSGLPVDNAGHVTKEGFEMVGVREFADLGKRLKDGTRGVWFTLSEKELERWEAVNAVRAKEDQKLVAGQKRRMAELQKKFAQEAKDMAADKAVAPA